MNRIKELRLRNGMDQCELANMIGVAQSQIGNYENGKRSPRNKEIWDKLAEILGVSVPYLMGYDCGCNHGKTKDQKIIHQAVDNNGHDAQIGIFHEEVGELLQAINKFKRGFWGVEEIATEIADVEICLEQLKYIFDCHAKVETEKVYKIKRISQREGLSDE